MNSSIHLLLRQLGKSEGLFYDGDENPKQGRRARYITYTKS